MAFYIPLFYGIFFINIIILYVCFDFSVLSHYSESPCINKFLYINVFLENYCQNNKKRDTFLLSFVTNIWLRHNVTCLELAWNIQIKIWKQRPRYGPSVRLSETRIIRYGSAKLFLSGQKTLQITYPSVWLFLVYQH